MARIRPISAPPDVCVNGFGNRVRLAAIKDEKRVVWRVDGLTTHSSRSSRNLGSRPRRLLGIPIQTLLTAKDGSGWVNFCSLRMCVYSVRNRVDLAAIKV